MIQWCNQVHLGSCIDELNKLDPASNSVDLVFADPPYNIGYSYDVYDDQLDSDTYLKWTESWLHAVHRILKPTGSLWIAIGDEYVAELKNLADKVGFRMRNWVIWYYTFGVHCTRKFTRSHTHLLYFVKDPKHFTFNDKDIRVRSARQLVYNDGRADSRGRVPDNTWILRPQDAPGAFCADDDTWYFARVAGTFKERAGFHGCQMPERLLERIIRACSNPDEIVLDPFAGSASALIVAKKLGRRWVGYELSPEYVRHGSARLDAVRPGDPIEGPDDPLTSAPSTPIPRPASRQLVDEQGILEAFRAASDGFSVDRVLADPVLNASFTEQCSRLGLQGSPRDWNLKLLTLRKAGQVLQTGTVRRTQFLWESMDPFLFASEIALRRMLDLGYQSLDYVLSDPLTAAKFDNIARSLVPGFTSLQYRWAALRLRKDARLWRLSSEKIGAKPLPRCSAQIRLSRDSFPQLRPGPAVYLLLPARKDAKPIYVGETWNFLGCAERMLHAQSALDLFVPNSGEWDIAVFELEGTGQRDRRGLQSLLIGQNLPAMNYLELAPEPG